MSAKRKRAAANDTIPEADNAAPEVVELEAAEIEETMAADAEAVEAEEPATAEADETEEVIEVAPEAASETDAALERARQLRMLEALLFAAAEPLDEATLKKRLPKKVKVGELLEELAAVYSNRGVNLGKVAGRWSFFTAPDLAEILAEHRQVRRKLSRAAQETLAIIAYHQPVTRAEIEAIRGVTISKGTIDVLLETGWVRFRGRRLTPGRPVTYGTTDEFLIHFGLDDIKSLPGLEELRAQGLLEGIPSTAGLPMPGESIADAGEEPLDEDDDGREYLEEPEMVAETAAEAEPAEVAEDEAGEVKAAAGADPA